MSKKPATFQSQKRRLRLNDFERFVDFSIGLPYSFQSTPHNEQLAESLIKRGELLLLQGDLKGNQFFDLAVKLFPSNAKFLYQMGLSLFEYGSEKGKEKILLLACKRFKKAVRLDPQFFEAWQAWGNTLYLLGKTFKEYHFFLEAKDKYAKALLKAKDKAPDVLAELHWENGCIWTELSFHSGEALDWHIAFKSFETATHYQEYFPAEFWMDYGCTALNLGKRVNDVRFYLKAINCYKNAVSISLSSFEAWFNLAETLTTIYHASHDEDHFTQANECYITAAGLAPQKVELWINWAAILLESGKRLRDSKRLRSAIEKCHKAVICSPNNEEIIAIWSEALAFLGLISDRIELIYRGQDKIASIFEKKEAPEFCYAYGMCLFALGEYYNEVDYYYQAIEKFQEGLSINRASPKLWHALGYTYTICGQIEQDVTDFEKACRFYQKALHLETNSTFTYNYAFALFKLAEMTHHQKTLELANAHFEKALVMQKNAIYLHPEWLFQYALSLDLMGDLAEEDAYYVKAIEILNHVLMVDPEFPEIHYQLALTFGHFGQLIGEIEPLHRALHHFRLAHKRDEENDHIILDWGLTLIHLGEIFKHSQEAEFCFREAEHKLIQAAKLGNANAYYHLSCLYSLIGQIEKAMHFIEKARIFESLPSLEEILDDDWLDNLRETEPFKYFILNLETKPNLQED